MRKQSSSSHTSDCRVGFLPKYSFGIKKPNASTLGAGSSLGLGDVRSLGVVPGGTIRTTFQSRIRYTHRLSMPVSPSRRSFHRSRVPALRLAHHPQ